MSWVKIDDALHDSSKIALISDAAFRLWSMALCWSNRSENEGTQGFIPEALLATKISEGRWPGAKLKKLVGELVSCGEVVKKSGLWQTVKGGWQIHDWADYRPATPKLSREDAARVAGQRSAEARRERNGTAQPNAPERNSNVRESFEATFEDSFGERRSADVRSNVDSNVRTPVPVPVPVPKDPKDRSVDPRPLDLIEEPPLDTPVFCPGEILNHDTIIAISAALGVSEAAIRAGLREFVSYWTIGAGAGRRHSLAKWRAKAREDVRQKAGRGLLLEPETPDPQVPEVDNERRNSERLAREQAYAAQARERLLGGPVATLSAVRRRNGPEAPTETKARETGAQEQQQTARVAQ
jgi:hypothetical protein